MSDRLNHLPRRSIAELVLVLLQRIAAAYCLAFGVLYWARIIGLDEGSGWRFDLMPVHWQVAAATLAVFFPFAAIGLWMLASWGPVIWLICAAAETAMYGAFPDLFGENRLALASHALSIALYAAARLVIFVQKRREAVSGH